MHCPFCMEEIKDGATHCRFCNRDLTYFAVSQAMQKKVSTLEDKISEISTRLDYIQTEPPNSMERSRVPASFIGTLIVAAFAAFHTAVNAAISREPERAQVILKRMAAAVSLAVAIPVLSNQVLHLIALIPHIFSDNAFLIGAAWVVIGLITTLGEISWYFFPLALGFWAALSWPGRHRLTYAVLGLLVGLLTMSAELLLELFGGSIGAPTVWFNDMFGDPHYDWLAQVSHINWPWSIITLFVPASALFTL
jgi:hypothetical protein